MNRLSVFLVFVFCLTACDTGPGHPFESGLSLDVVNDPQLSWHITNATYSRTVAKNFSGNTKNVFIKRCWGCTEEVKLVAVPTKPAPDGCRGWEPQTEDFYIPDQGTEHTQWHLDPPEPVPFGCADQ